MVLQNITHLVEDRYRHISLSALLQSAGRLPSWLQVWLPVWDAPFRALPSLQVPWLQVPSRTVLQREGPWREAPLRQASRDVPSHLALQRRVFLVQPTPAALREALYRVPRPSVWPPEAPWPRLPPMALPGVQWVFLEDRSWRLEALSLEAQSSPQQVPYRPP